MEKFWLEPDPEEFMDVADAWDADQLAFPL